MLWVVLKEVKCVPLVVEAFGDWEITASGTFSRIARRLHGHTPTHRTLNSTLLKKGCCHNTLRGVRTPV